ncbi:hypothetical protein M758_4G247300 [Ceratodon purpureus]|nr:hypothetical protein M758_4G247300 [Ceratodon purpureus]
MRTLNLSLNTGRTSFLHYLFTVRDEIISEVQAKILSDVLEACRACAQPWSMVQSVFNILDPRGRTILHAALRPDNLKTLETILNVLKQVVRGIRGGADLVWECANARDGAGRTILHLMAIHDYNHLIWEKFQRDILIWEATVIPLCNVELEALKYWCFQLPHHGKLISNDTPILLAIIFNSIRFFESLSGTADFFRADMKLLQQRVIPVKDKFGLLTRNRVCRPFQIAAFLGRSKIVDKILRTRGQIDYILDIGFGNEGPEIQEGEEEGEEEGILDIGYGNEGPEIQEGEEEGEEEGNNEEANEEANEEGEEDGEEILLTSLPAIHCAALSSQVETIQTILKYPIFDPLIQDPSSGTALHFLLQKEDFQKQLDTFRTLALSHVLPNSVPYTRVKNDFVNLQIDHNIPRMFSANEMGCINLLLQAGIDIWTRADKSKERPSPGPTANDEARKWWFERVVTEVLAQKASVSNAANATSVVAALVATASFLGPFTPPLSYSLDTNGGYIHTSVCAVRVFMVCNSFSFLFSIASILMAVLPAIPMPKESLYDELFRSQRCLKFAALMLLIAILCLLAAFSSASIAVVSSEVHDWLVVVPCILLGGIICAIVLVIYIIRMLRMLFHKNDRFRRWFAKNMKI